MNGTNIHRRPLRHIMLIGLTGKNASGKSTIVSWFSEKGLRSVSCSDSIRSWLRNQEIEETRNSLIEGGRQLRRSGGPSILADMLLEILNGEDAVVDSIRTPDEVASFRKRGDFWLIEIRASEEMRWERLKKRNRPGDPEDRETFVRQDKTEESAKDKAGQDLLATAELADYIIENNGSIEQLETELEGFWNEIKHS